MNKRELTPEHEALRGALIEAREIIGVVLNTSDYRPFGNHTDNEYGLELHADSGNDD